MKTAKSFLAAALALLLVVCPLLQPVNVSAADVDGELALTYRYGTNNLIQMNTNLPSDTPCVNFTTGDNGCSIDQSGNTVQWVGWIGMDNVDGTIVLTFHFNNAFTAGQSYVLPKGAVFGFTDGKTYALDGDYTFTFDGSSWTMDVQNVDAPEAASLNFAYRYGTSTLIQVNTDLPSDTPLANFTADSNGCSIDQSGNTVQWVGWIQMDNADGTIVLTFHFNNAFTAGQTYFLPAGAIFGFTDGNKYALDKDYTFKYDGSSWSVVEPVKNVTLSYRYGTNNLIQYNTDLPATTPIANFLAADNGSNLIQSGNQQVGWIEMANADGTIVLTFHFNSAFEVGQCYSLASDSVFGFTDGNSYVQASGLTLYWDGSSWTENQPHVHSYVAETTPADCENDGKTVYTCSGCGDSYEEIIPAGHKIEYVAAVVPANCQETGHDEYWYCAGCEACFGDAEGSYQVNPAWIYYTGEHVRPEDAIVCAVVPCELCGEDSYGEACDRGDAPVCQDAPCVNCGETVYGWGCNYNTGDEEVPLPLCQPGDCIYCGTHYEKIYDCENGAWSACLDGECAYGCGKQFPATEPHTVTVCEGGLCEKCWNTIEAVGHNYESVVTPPTATKEGFTTHTCSGCGDSYVDSTVPAIGIGELKFTGASLELRDDLTIRFSAKADLFIEDAYTAPYAVFQVGYKTQTVTEYQVVDGKYVFLCTNLAPSQMGDVVNATLYGTLNGVECSHTTQYSVANYCYDMLEKTEDAKLRTLMVDMLNYGSAAQVYAWYKDKTPCNAKLTEEQKSWGTATAPSLGTVLSIGTEVAEEAATWKAAGLVLDNSVVMRFRFAAESLEGLSVKIAAAGKEWTVSEFEAVEGKNGQYYVYFNELDAHQMRETVSVTVYKGGVVASKTLTYSVESYVYAMQDVARVGDLVKAMICYGDSAAAYIN